MTSLWEHIMITSIDLNEGQKRSLEDWMQSKHPSISGIELLSCDHYQDSNYRVHLVGEDVQNKERRLNYFVNMQLEENSITDIEFDC